MVGRGSVGEVSVLSDLPQPLQRASSVKVHVSRVEAAVGCVSGVLGNQVQCQICTADELLGNLHFLPQNQLFEGFTEVLLYHILRLPLAQVQARRKFGEGIV